MAKIDCTDDELPAFMKEGRTATTIEMKEWLKFCKENNKHASIEQSARWLNKQRVNGILEIMDRHEKQVEEVRRKLGLPATEAQEVENGEDRGKRGENYRVKNNDQEQVPKLQTDARRRIRREVLPVLAHICFYEDLDLGPRVPVDCGPFERLECPHCEKIFTPPKTSCAGVINCPHCGLEDFIEGT